MSKSNKRTKKGMGLFKVIAAFFFGMILLACADRRSSENQSDSTSLAIALQYAEGFKISVVGNAKLIEVIYPFQGATSGYRYLLVPRGEKAPSHSADTKVIYTPLESIVCTSTTHIPLLDYLGETRKLVGFPTTDYISSEKMRDHIDAGRVVDLGIDKGMNIERLAVLKPDVVMGYSMSSDYGQFKKIEDMGIPVIINAEYLEKHPLGRAEWIKFMAAFFEKDEIADSVFLAIEKNYLETKALTREIGYHPSILSGIVYGDAWFLPGGQNNVAKLFKDAGCRYLWEDNQSHGYLELSFEAVYAKAHEADFWIGTGTYHSLDELKAGDHRYALFKPFQKRQVYHYDARQGAKGGNEYLELGYLRPDLILMDLVKIAHPELLPEYHLYFHQKLQ